MKKLVLWLLAILALILLFVGGTSLYEKLSENYQIDSLAVATEAPENTSSLAPDFTVLDRNGNEVSLSSFRGKPVVINFWASWCPPCKAEMPDFQEVYEEYGDKVIFMMVDMTDGARETVDTAKEFIEEKGYTFPVYFDVYGSAAMTYGASSIPVSFFVDGDGNAIARASGALDKESLLRAISMILE